MFRPAEPGRPRSEILILVQQRTRSHASSAPHLPGPFSKDLPVTRSRPQSRREASKQVGDDHKKLAGNAPQRLGKVPRYEWSTPDQRTGIAASWRVAARACRPVRWPAAAGVRTGGAESTISTAVCYQICCVGACSDSGVGGREAGCQWLAPHVGVKSHARLQDRRNPPIPWSVLGGLLVTSMLLLCSLSRNFVPSKLHCPPFISRSPSPPFCQLGLHLLQLRMIAQRLNQMVGTASFFW